ncbi:hypothetical protein KAI60_02350 [Candidatus Bathyarchaeota archaeon]|nr:hypothetical protein [Candidatus Bathyarchaeota archaeon]
MYVSKAFYNSISTIYTNMLTVIILIILIILVIAILLKINYKAEQKIRCPFCQLEFVADLFILGSSTLVICPFCHKWLSVKKFQDKYIIRRLFA